VSLTEPQDQAGLPGRGLHLLRGAGPRPRNTAWAACQGHPDAPDGITADAAFACLSRASQHTNVKLVDVARQLAETGELVGVPAAGPAASVPG